MKLNLAIVVVALQVLLLGYMGGEREWIARTGRTIVLRTAPVDPRDPMRGDYLRLNYEISQVPRRICRDGLLKLFDTRVSDPTDRDIKVYASLRINAGGFAEVASLSDCKPSTGFFLRGRSQSVFADAIDVRWGIEAVFMQQGKAGQLEETQSRERRGVPLDVEVAVGPSGTAVFKRYQWEPLGIIVTLDRPARSPRQPGEPEFRRLPATAATIELKNHGPNAVAIVDLPNLQSFHLRADDHWQEARYRWVGENRPHGAPGPADVIVLKPGESRQWRIDLTRPEWFVTDAKAGAKRGEPIALQSIAEQWSAYFRIEYVPPSVESTQGLSNAALIQHRQLHSGAFEPFQYAD
jgi:uncharacterized membrane-anchored protein